MTTLRRSRDSANDAAATSAAIPPEHSPQASAWQDGERPRLTRVAMRIVHDHQVAGEIVQSAFIRAFQRLATFRGESQLKTWLTRITQRVALNELRRQKRYHNRTVPLDAVTSTHHVLEPPDPLVIARVRAAVDALPESLRLPLLLTEIEGYTHAEVAKKLGITPGASRTRATRARDLLRIALADLSPEKDSI